MIMGQARVLGGVWQGFLVMTAVIKNQFGESFLGCMIEIEIEWDSSNIRQESFAVGAARSFVRLLKSD